MFKIITTIALSIFTILILLSCKDEPIKKEIKKYKYTTAQVYQHSCIRCHGEYGEGNLAKKIPALSNKTSGELAQSLYDIKNGGTDAQSSGTRHEIMEYNTQKLIEQGYDYDIDSMAEYLSNLNN